MLFVKMPGQSCTLRGKLKGEVDSDCIFAKKKICRASSVKGSAPRPPKGPDKENPGPTPLPGKRKIYTPLYGMSLWSGSGLQAGNTELWPQTPSKTCLCPGTPRSQSVRFPLSRQGAKMCSPSPSQGGGFYHASVIGHS